MYIAKCKLGDAWTPKILPYGSWKLILAGVLNYGQGIFEGMKAHRTINDRVVIFRAEQNARRFQSGADRPGMPPIPESIS